MLQILAVSLIASVIPWPVAKALYTPRGIGSFNETQSFNLPLSLQSNDSVIRESVYIGRLGIPRTITTKLTFIHTVTNMASANPIQ